MALSAMRSGVMKIIFLGILVLGAVGLVLSDQGNFFQDGLNDTDVITIDGYPIKSSEFDRIVRQNLAGKNISAQDAYRAGIIDRIAKNEIMLRLLNRAAHEYGLSASDATVATEMHRILQPMAGPGGDVKEALKRVLQAQNMSEAALVESMRNDIATNILRRTIGEGIYVPDAMTRAFYEWNMEERKIRYVAIPDSKADVKQPTDEQLTSFYRMMESEYMIPESRDVTIAVLDLAPLTKNVTITDEQVKKFYDDHQKDFAIDETRSVEQAVVKTEQEARDILDAAQVSKNLKEAVKKVTGSESAYNKAADFGQNALPGPLAEPVFDAKEGDFAGPFKTALGFHVVRVNKINAAGTRKFDDVKDHIKKELAQNSSNDAAYEVTTAIEDRLAGGEKPQDLAEEYNLKIMPVKGLSPSSDADVLKDFGTDRTRVAQAAFIPVQGESSPLSEITGNKMFTVYVDAVHTAKPKELSTVKEEVTKKWRAAEIRKKLLVESMKMTGALDAKKISLEEIAKQYGAKIQTGTAVRGSNPPAGITKQGLSQIMISDTDKAVAVPGEGNIAIVQIESVVLPKKQPTPSELSNIQKNLALDLQEERFGAFVDHIQKSAKVRINQALIDKLYGQEAAE